MERHFTVSGFLVEDECTLLQFHGKEQIWLPPGGHIEPNEDPVQAVIREVREETGIAAEIVPHAPPFAYSNVTQLPPPMSILVADVQARTHQHIDMIYALRPIAGADAAAPEQGHEFIWVSEPELESAALLRTPNGTDAPIPEDVRVLALAAIRVVGDAAGS